MSPEPVDFIHQYIDTRSETTLLLLHGTGGNEHDLLDLGETLLPAANFLSPRGKIVENGQPRFFKRSAEGVFDYEDLARQSAALTEFVSRSAKTYSFPLEKLIVVGYSNGANIALYTLATRPEMFARALLFRPSPQAVPADPLPLTGKKIALLASSFDELTPLEALEETAALLKNRGAEIQLITVPAGHGLIPADLDYAQSWIQSMTESSLFSGQERVY